MPARCRAREVDQRIQMRHQARRREVVGEPGDGTLQPLQRGFWRQGVASNALALISDWALANLPQVMRLYAPIFGWNEGSQAVARHCGYALEGRHPVSALKAGQLIDRVVYGRYRPGAIGVVPTLPA